MNQIMKVDFITDTNQSMENFFVEKMVSLPRYIDKAIYTIALLHWFVVQQCCSEAISVRTL